METRLSVWQRWSGMIFWSIIALTVFGWLAGVFQYFVALFSVLPSIAHGIELLGETGLADSAQSIYSMVEKPFIGFQSVCLICWILYLVGIYRFREVQSSESSTENVKQISKACWFGIAGLACSFIAMFMPYGAGWLFSLPGWILTLFSYIFLKEAFGSLAEEETWSARARKGASQLKRSAGYNIKLMLYPFIALMVMVFTGFVLYAMLGSYDSMKEGLKTSAMIIVIEIVVFVLWLLYLSIMQFVYRIIGWYKIWQGGPAEGALTVDEEQEPVNGGNNKNVLYWILGIIGCLILVPSVIFGLVAAFSGDKTSDDVSDEFSEEYVEEVVVEQIPEEEFVTDTPDLQMFGLKGAVESVSYQNEDSDKPYLTVKFDDKGCIVVPDGVQVERDSSGRLTKYYKFVGNDSEDNFTYEISYKGDEMTPSGYTDSDMGHAFEYKLKFINGVLKEQSETESYEGDDESSSAEIKYTILKTDSEGNWISRKRSGERYINYVTESSDGEYLPRQHTLEIEEIQNRVIKYRKK